MPHISLPEGLPGISSGFAFRPETARPMRELAHILLHGHGTLTPGERELIATFVSSRNDCYFCQTSHGAAATAHFGDNSKLVEQVKHDFLQANISDKLNCRSGAARRQERHRRKRGAGAIAWRDRS